MGSSNLARFQTKAGPRQSHMKQRLTDRDRKIYREYCDEKITKVALAARHGMTHGNVCRIIKAVDKEIREELRFDVGVMKRAHTRRLEKLYVESLAAWEESKKKFKKYTRVKKTSGKETTVTIERQCGDARFLETAMRALADIRKIWGADAAEKQEHEFSGSIGVAAAVVVIESEDWYGQRIARPDPQGHFVTDCASAPAGDSDQPGPVQGGDMRPAMGEDGGGLAGGG